jgi:hypothetical protein
MGLKRGLELFCPNQTLEEIVEPTGNNTGSSCASRLQPPGSGMGSTQTERTGANELPASRPNHADHLLDAAHRQQVLGGGA